MTGVVGCSYWGEQAIHSNPYRHTPVRDAVQKRGIIQIFWVTGVERVNVP
jgi:hypothetical protein